MIFLVWLTVLVSCFVLYQYKIYSKFSKFGIRQIKPLPIVGNSGNFLLRNVHFVNNFSRLYNAFPDDRFVGNFNFMEPAIVIRDLELIKKIGIKDCEIFLDHALMVDDGGDELFRRVLLSLKGQEWKDMRSSLSPAFTSSKMRFMVPFINEVSNQMVKSLKKRIEDSKEKYIDEDVRDLTSRFANDVIATCAFGLNVDSHTDTDNEFYRMGKAATTISFLKFITLSALLSLPKFLRIFQVHFFDREVVKFFHKHLMNSIYEREVKKLYRPDMIHLLMEAKKGKLTDDSYSHKDDDAGFPTDKTTTVDKEIVNRGWSDIDLVAQAITFFFAGFETVSTTMSFILHELALAPTVLERLVQEIKDTQSKNRNEFDYKLVQDMVYLDMVISESLRKWPAVPILDRVCKKDYNLGKPHDKASRDYIIREGEGINIPAWSIHYDPKYHPNPEKFDPERFSEENKHLIKPFTYMPFGVGPRNCIGSRFALCEIKLMLYHLLSHFELSPCERTSRTNELDTSPGLRLKGGHWLRFKIRS